MKAKVNNNVNQTVNNLSLNERAYTSTFLQLARMCKEEQEVAPTHAAETFNIRQEDYDHIRAILRLTGNEDIPVSAYVDAILFEFLLTHDEEGIKKFAEEIIKRRKA